MSNVLDIIKVDLLDMSLLLDMTVITSWSDPSVRYKNLRRNRNVNQIYHSRGNAPVWTPMVTVEPVEGFPVQKKVLSVRKNTNGTIEQDGEYSVQR